MKYWSDKNSAVKKKACLRAANRNKTGGGTGDIIELTEIEEKMITIMGGEGFAIGDSNLRILLFNETSQQQGNPSTSTTVPLLEHDTRSIIPSTSNDIIEWINTDSTLTIGTSPSILVEEPVIVAAEASAVPSNHPPNTIYGPHRITLHPETETEEPIIRRRPALGHRTPTQSHILHTMGTTTPRRRSRTVLTGSPPSQRRTQFTSIAERFLLVEEQRVDMEHTRLQQNNNLIQTVTDFCDRIISQNAQSSRMAVQATTSLGEVAKIGEGMLALSNAIQRNRDSN